ncbi:hypothetical protein TNCV_5064621 [Trichonephila clavipes]|nr:hypothetical protein TNCV_5064621 [Trichonephila clavipes]
MGHASFTGVRIILSPICKCWRRQWARAGVANPRHACCMALFPKRLATPGLEQSFLDNCHSPSAECWSSSRDLPSYGGHRSKLCLVRDDGTSVTKEADGYLAGVTESITAPPTKSGFGSLAGSNK